MLVAVVTVGWTLYEVISFTLLQFVVLAVALAVSALVNQHELKIPNTKITLNAADLTVFTGIILLGIPGGILLAASVAAVRCGFAPEDKERWIFDDCLRIIAAAPAGIVFSTAFGEATVLQEFLIEKTDSFGALAIAILLSSAAYYLIFGGLNILSHRIESEFFRLREAVSVEFVRFRQISVFSLPTAFALCLSLREFGLLFGIVILLMAVVGHYSHLFHNSRLDEKTREISEASRVHLATVEALATAIDARDQIGTGHVTRTQIYALGIGKILKLSDDELKALKTSALLHDIGKLAIPDHILNKPGSLTSAEMEKIKIHSAVGAFILEKVNFSYPVVPAVRHHHEMWDGSGYPDGLKGEEIPVTARILAVADAYDTLRGARPYRPAISREDARRFLINGAGTQFDRRIVDVFLRNMQEIETEIEARQVSYDTDGENIVTTLPIIFEACSDQSYLEQIKRANREVYALYELARVFSTSLNLEETLTLLVKKIGELVSFDDCVVYLMDDSENFAAAAYAKGENSHLFRGKRIQIGEGGTGYVLKKRQAVCNIKPNLDFIYSQSKPAREYSAMVSLPLIGNEKIIGAVSLYSTTLRTYDEENLRLLETVTRIASDAIGMSLQHAESENRALTDPMTDLPNARSLRMQFEKEVARANRHDGNFQVLMLDLDGFKSVNDTFGHHVGDRMLREITQVMRNQLRDYDFLARYAGDEFVAIIPETDSPEIAELCERMQKAVDDFTLSLEDGRTARVGVSIGAACYPNHGETLDQVIVFADKAMYAEKAARKAKRLLKLKPEDLLNESNYIVELDETHIISSAVN